MATVEQLLAESKQSKKFKRVEYRPWNFMEEMDKETITSDNKQRQDEGVKKTNQRQLEDKVEPTKRRYKDKAETIQANKTKTKVIKIQHYCF